MTQLDWLFIWLLCLIASIDSEDQLCPAMCRCQQAVTDCSRLNLTSVPLSISTNVRMLDLSGNLLKAVDIPNGLLLLEQLDVSQNEITDITIQNFQNLQSLDVSRNFLNNVKTDNLPKLKMLNLSHNKNLTLRDTTISEPLEYLDMSFCNVPSFEFLKKLPHLRTLILKGNRAHGLTKVKSVNLTTLDVSRGKIKLVDEETLLENYTNLQILDVSDNTDLILTFASRKKCLNLEKLHASNTAVSRVLLISLCRLQSADLSHSKISEIDQLSFKNNEYLNFLNLSFNEISTINKDAFNSTRKLLDLDLAKNILKDCLWGAHLTSLKTLNISNNLLNSFEDMNFPKLIFLDASNNDITLIPKNVSSILPQLEYLDLTENEIERIKPMSMPKLKRLILKNCEIEWVEPHALDKMDSLEYLDLTGNKLTRLYYTTLSVVTQLQTIQLGHNPWECDCKGDWMKDLFDYLLVNRSLTSSSDLLCNLPDEGHHKWQEVCGKEWYAHPHTAPSAVTTPLIIIGVFSLALFIVSALIYWKHKSKPDETEVQDTAVEEPLNLPQPSRNYSTLRRSQSAVVMGSGMEDDPPTYEEAVRMAPMTRSMDALVDRRLTTIVE